MAMPAGYDVVPDDASVVADVIAQHTWDAWRICTQTKCWGGAHYAPWGEAGADKTDGGILSPNWETDGDGQFRIIPGTPDWARLLIRTLCQVTYTALDGACRTADGGHGTYANLVGLSHSDCESACTADATCVVYEFCPGCSPAHCELHTATISYAEYRPFDVTCYWKTTAPSPTTSGTTAALP